MKDAILDFPIKHIDGNLVFGTDNTVTAYYRIGGFNYDFLDDDDKYIPFQNVIAFLYNNQYDLHFILEPKPSDVETIINQTISDMKARNYVLKANGLQYMENLKEYLVNQKKNAEVTDYIQYLGVQLRPELNKYKDSNLGINIINSGKALIQGLNDQINRAVGLQYDDILEDELELWHDQADTVMDSIRQAFTSQIRSATTAECAYLIEKEYSVSQSNDDVKIRRKFKTGFKFTAEDEDGFKQTAIRPVEKSFIELQDTNVNEIAPTMLEFSKVVDHSANEDRVKSLLARYLVVHTMDTENYFPGFEWIYQIQSSLNFPVSISIRAYHQSNEFIVKKISNKIMEFADQTDEANKAGMDADLDLQQSQQGAVFAQSYYKKSGQPSYECSFVFKITGETKKELNSRTKRLNNILIKYGIKIAAPYGEQLNLMMEKLLGSRQINKDYKQIVDAGVLAGMMFGATTSIGDNRGFFIGWTERLHKPVFIQPDLAAKAYEGLGNVEDSISALVAGATGKGKSYFMNLFTYLAVQTGSQALIIDPKGDRKNWDSLPLIPKDFISKWTLGEKEEDAGCLDPFRTSPDYKEGKEIALDILAYLTSTQIRDAEYTFISTACEAVSKTSDPCIGAVINYLVDLYNHRPDNMSDERYSKLDQLKEVLLSLKHESLAELLFGEVGQKERAKKVLKIDKPLQILMVQNLKLPEENSVNVRVSEKISESILISITAFTKQYMFNQDRAIHKIVLQDEAKAIDANPVGHQLMNFIIRMGRYYNTTLLKGSQNATDHTSDVANVGMKFSFGLRSTKEAELMLDFFNLAKNQSNIEKLKNMTHGQCLFQDIYGRTACIHIDPLFQELADAFNSATATKEEQERERERQRSEGIDDDDLLVVHGSESVS